MTDRYRVTRSMRGGYSVRETDLVEDVAVGAAGVAESIIGASINGIGALASQSKDRKMAKSVDVMTDVMIEDAQREYFDHLLKIATAFSRNYRQEPCGPACLSVALAGKGQYNDALAAVDKAVQLGLDSLEGTIFRINIYKRKGDTAKLLQEYTILTQDSERCQDGYFGRAQMLMEIGDFDQALADAHQVISLSPDVFGYCLRGDIYRAQGQQGKAVEDYTRAIRLDQNEAFLFERRAKVYELLGKTDEARADREAAQRVGAIDQELREAQELLHYLRENGVHLKIARNGRDLEMSGPRLKSETFAKIKRLKPKLLQILARE